VAILTPDRAGRWAKSHEVSALVWDINQETGVYVRAALVLNVLTSIRKIELVAACGAKSIGSQVLCAR